MPKNKMSINGKFFYSISSWKYSGFVRALLFLFLGIILYFSLSGELIPQSYNIREGTISEKTIHAPAQEINTAATSQAQDEAASRVPPVYKAVDMQNAALVETIYNKLDQINADPDMKTEDKVNIYRTVLPQLIQAHEDQIVNGMANSGKYSDALIAEMKKQLQAQKYQITEETFYKLPLLTSDKLTAMEAVTKSIVGKLMSDQMENADAARASVAELVNTSNLSDSTARELVQTLSRSAITPNKFLDQSATDEARAAARDHTKPVYYNKGDILAQKGQMITPEIYQQLAGLNLLQGKTNYQPEFGLGLLVLLLLLALYMFIRQSELPIRANNVQLLMLVLIFLLNVIGMKIVVLGQSLEYPYIGFLAPVAMGSLLIMVLFDMPISVIATVIFAILASIYFNGDSSRIFDFRYGFAALAAGMAAIFPIHRGSQRSTILKAGIMASLFACLTIASLVLLNNNYTSKEMMFAFSFAIVGGLLTAILVIGILPFFEAAFGILSPLKLVELSNPNHPLLRKLLTETPGTYHHSAMVGNLSEAAAESIGADGLLCRVGSYYHDIGKTKRPSYFIENQMNIENPHDHIEPGLSKSIIIAHARDGVEMLKEYKIPKPIRDIAEQHHGTTLLKYFYHKALKQAEQRGEPSVPESEYRYPGPKAQSKEAAIVGISDCVEAAVRSLHSPTIEQIDSMVQKIIKDRLEDGQFNECDLTLREIDKVAKTLKETLLGIFHSRIEYPNDIPGKGEQN